MCASRLLALIVFRSDYTALILVFVSLYINIIPLRNFDVLLIFSIVADALSSLQRKKCRYFLSEIMCRIP